MAGRTAVWWPNVRSGKLLALIVQSGTQNSDDKVGKMGRAFIELEPADDAMIGEIFCYASLGNAEMFGELRLEGVGASAACAAAQKISDGDAERLAGFDVIVAGEVGIGEDENTGTDRSVICVTKFHWRAGQETAKLHLEERQSGR